MTHTGKSLLLRGGPVYAVGAPTTAVLVRDGRIAWIGDEAGADALLEGAGAVTRTVHLDGCLLMPAFVDSHVHLAATGLAVGVPDLSRVRSAAQLLDAVALAAASLDPDRTVLGFGWDDSGWNDSGWNEPRLPSRAELDRAAGGRPVFLGRIDVHSALVTGPVAAVAGGAGAVSAAGRIGAPPDAPTSLVHWDDRPGALSLPRLLADLLTRADRCGLLIAALDLAAARGVGLVHEMAAPQLADLDDLSLLDELGVLLRPADDDRGPGSAAAPHRMVRPLVAAWWGQHADSGGVATAIAAGATGCGGDLCVDGSLGSRTAALRADYTDLPGSAGDLYLDAAGIAAHVAACALAGVRTGFHLIGDRAAAAVADGLALAAGQVGVAAVAATAPRLEHAELIPDELLAGFARLGVTASVQPAFATTWGGPGGMYEQRLGSDRAGQLNRFADFTRAGIPLVFGSDSPVTPLAGWASVRDASAHPDPVQAPSLRHAVAAATRGGWRCAGRPEVGRIAVGAAAHLAWFAVTDGWQQQDGDDRVARWSTDPASGVPPLPALGPDRALPDCRGLLVGGRPAAVPAVPR